MMAMSIFRTPTGGTRQDWPWQAAMYPTSRSSPSGTTIAFELELTRKNFEVYGHHILPDLLRHYDFALYLATGDAYNAIVSARRDTLSSNEERKRIRIIRFDPE